MQLLYILFIIISKCRGPVKTEASVVLTAFLREDFHF